MEWFDEIPFDPSYPIGSEGDGLDPLTREELDRIKREQESEKDDVPWIPY